MTKKKPTELLAPAGSADAAWAALAYGADAVYAGLPRFSARAEAANFSTEQLDELIGYAHAHGKKVYIALNTLVQQHELPDALEALAQINDLNADGVIVQDMGVARMARRFFPKLELHASTQLAVHNTAGAQLLADIGFSRVVLARELSLKEIDCITRGCGIETEAFIHGALCYSYSGLCLFSSHVSGRSGNRGRCAYCCRQTFDSDGSKGLPFSMKDFAVGAHFDELLATGVASLKIEGRMKGDAYVGAVTDFYRRRMDRGLDEKEQRELLSDIQTIFGRPATDLYLKKSNTNPIDPTTNGHRGAAIGTIESIRTERNDHWLCLNTNRALQKYDGLKIELAGKEPYGFSATEIRLQNDRKKHLKFEVPANAGIEVKLPESHPYLESGLTVYCSISQEVRQRYGFEAPRPGTYRQQKPFDASVKLTSNGVTVRSGQTEITIDEALSEARQPERTESAIRKSFEKTGGTEWRLGQLTVEDNGLFAPASVMNDVRRNLLEQLSAEFETHKQLEHFARLEDLVQPPADPSDQERWSIRLRDLSLLDDLNEEELERINEIVLEGEAPPEPHPPIRMAIPVIQRESRLTDHGSRCEVANVGALHARRDCSDLVADWPLYTLNTEAAEQWRELGIKQNVLSPEDTGDNLKALLGLLGGRAIVPVYQHTPLMISATPPDAGEILSDRKKKPMKVEKNGDEHVLIYEEPFSLIEHLDELREAGARNFRIDLTYGIRDAAHAAEVVRDALEGLPPAECHDGNYGRTL
ncbi:putative protease YdcP [Pontiella desulfatans]|uniref:Putative protease YdcP n=1 Tax=Pontiella desulfatans TaxID=2750659 RepID=A0A6C2U7T6_PONDE|nr:U32 family peptidase [Pontiella desulfatans]VGO15797.1 putative protease YdcP [Pontiella desulfatans]